MTTPTVDLSGYTDDDLTQLRSDILVELDRRAKLASIPEVMETLNKQYLEADGVQQGQEWVQPTGAHDAYPMDWQVTHNDKTWQSLCSANVWEPGVANWSEVVPVGTVPEWIQPTGATDAYAQGAHVMHNSQEWSSDVADNVWEPGVFGWTVVA